MASFFAGDYQGPPLRTFDVTHLGALAAIALGCLLLGFCWRAPTPLARRVFRYGLAAVLLSVNVSWQIWCSAWGVWSVQTNLPLHLCTAMVYVSALMLLSKSYRAYEICYFAGVGGAIQALLTPDVGAFGFPHYGYFHFFVGHGATIAAAIYMTTIEGFRPRWRSIVRVAIGLNLYIAAVFVANYWLGSNYMYLMRKPPTPSLLDYLGPWPWYILAGEPIGLAVFVLLYLPFVVRDRREARRQILKDAG